MKETVAKPAKKTGSHSAAAPDRKSGVVKAVASALANKIAGVLTPAPESEAPPKAKAAAKPAARPAKTASKAPAAGATAVPKKSAAAAAKQAASVKAGSAKVAAPAAASQVSASKAAAAKTAAPAKNKTVAQPAVKAGETGERTEAVGGVTAELADKIKTSVVSKVSEVMTKTTKSAPAVNAEVRLISEDEIRAMSEKDYMNAAQLAFFKARLQQLEKDLLKNAGETTEHLRETVLVPDPADRATIEEEHALELRTRDRERKLLKKVQQSIAAIDGGDYGWCEETGEPIGIPRLIARPTATLSLEAQQRRELKQKLYGD
jgi:DnaK suppressor protein